MRTRAIKAEVISCVGKPQQNVRISEEDAGSVFKLRASPVSHLSPAVTYFPQWKDCSSIRVCLWKGDARVQLDFAPCWQVFSELFQLFSPCKFPGFLLFQEEVALTVHVRLLRSSASTVVHLPHPAPVADYRSAGLVTSSTLNKMVTLPRELFRFPALLSSCYSFLHAFIPTKGEPSALLLNLTACREKRSQTGGKTGI